MRALGRSCGAVFEDPSIASSAAATRSPDSELAIRYVCDKMAKRYSFILTSVIRLIQILPHAVTRI